MEKLVWFKDREKLVILTLLFLGGLLGGLDRYTINFAVVLMEKDLNLSAASIGMVLSAFFAGYAIMQMPGGWLADKFGSRRVILVSITAWSIFTILTGIAWSLPILILIRFMYGIGEGGYFPASASLVAQKFEKNESGRAISVLLSASYIMGFLAPLITTSLMASIGWRKMFYVYGFGGFLILPLFYFLLKGPEQPQPSVDQNPSARETEKKYSLKGILGVPMLWLVFVGAFGTFTVMWGIASWMPTLLHKVYGLDLRSIGWYAFFPPFLSLITIYIGGFLTDKLPLKTSKLLAGFCLGCAAIMLFIIATISLHVLLLNVLMTIITMACSIVIIVFNSIPLKQFPGEAVGFTSGFIYTGTQIAGFTAPLIMGIIVDAFGGSFTGAFVYLMVISLIGMVCFFAASRFEGQVVSRESLFLNSKHA
ncbi:MAG: MFS transporter [Deltaproteobacteria bacterium]|nr:MFS transporter [Deltaproteobacteria bacterium]